ncbi:hypothetical protein A3G62_03420 [Candidatus Kaiserbacteria bacterium RIFCSPLOWO2_12_FULL_50_10]|nr:MAG: hypothetical protein A3G62_03420 [Candidatus Kaiserbacteria bacterium RIFCSPLOWO2_12_FULL_50_10]
MTSLLVILFVGIAFIVMVYKMLTAPPRSRTGKRGHVVEKRFEGAHTEVEQLWNDAAGMNLTHTFFYPDRWFVTMRPTGEFYNFVEVEVSQELYEKLSYGDAVEAYVTHDWFSPVTEVTLERA